MARLIICFKITASVAEFRAHLKTIFERIGYARGMVNFSFELFKWQK